MHPSEDVGSSMVRGNKTSRERLEVRSVGGVRRDVAQNHRLFLLVSPDKGPLLLSQE